MLKLSKAAYQFDGQPMFKVLDQVQRLEREGRKILHFELGEPDFDTPINIVNAGISSLRNGDTHYTNSMGLFELRESDKYIKSPVSRACPSIDKVSNIGWEPSIGTKEGFNRTIKSFLK